MKQQDNVANTMQLDQVPTLAPNLLCAQKVSRTRSERARTPGHIESIIPSYLEMVCKEVVRCFLKSPIGARDDERARSVWQPLPEPLRHSRSPGMIIHLTPKLSCKGINKMQRRSRCYHSALDCSNAR